MTIIIPTWLKYYLIGKEVIPYIIVLLFVIGYIGYIWVDAIIKVYKLKKKK